MNEYGVLVLSGTPIPWWESAIVFAGFNYGPECLILITKGQHEGCIFFYDHDQDTCEWIADSVDSLLERIMADPARFMRRYGTGYGSVIRYEAG